MMVKILQWVGAVLFLPVCFGYSMALVHVLGFSQGRDDPGMAFLLGITVYLAIQVFLGVSSRVYRFGQGLTHGAANWITGRGGKGLPHHPKQGSGRVDRKTAWGALIVHGIPIYAILWTLLFAGVGLFWETAPWMPLFFFGLGAASAFHAVFAIDAMRQERLGGDSGGLWLSLEIVYLIGLSVVVGLMSLMTPKIHWGAYLQDGFRTSSALYRTLFVQLFLK